MKVDERGKYYTDRVTTRHVEVLVLTPRGQVRGEAHLMPGQRIKDMLNHEEQFIALTDVTITGDDASIQHAEFIALNKLHIISLIPLEAPKEKEPEEYEHYPY